MMQLQSEWADGGEAYGSTQVADNPQQPCGGHGQGCHGSGLCFPSCQPLTAREGADPFGKQVARGVVGGRVSSP